MKETTIISKIIKHGKNQFKLVGEQWYILTFGWFPAGTNPRYSWEKIDKSNVPSEVIEVGSQGGE